MKSGKIAGSHDSDGNVPNVNFNGDKMNVNRNSSDNYNDNLRARQKFQAKSPV